MIEAALINAGVDYITCTAGRGRRSRPFRDLAESILASERAEGNDLRRASWFGYDGMVAGRASVGVRHDGWYCQLRSEVARERARELIPLADNISRLDLQFTIKLKRDRPQLIFKEYLRLREGVKTKGRPSTYRIVASPTDGDTLYVGKRTSDRFGRFYDTGAESRAAPKGRFLRYELESHRTMAMRYAAAIEKHDDPQAVSLREVSHYFKSRGVSMLIATRHSSEVLTTHISDATKRYDWLARYVRGTVCKLVERDGPERACHALGLCAHLSIECSLCSERS